jgi:hypothetical protein
MEYSTFMDLLDMATSFTQKNTTVMKDTIPASQRLSAITPHTLENIIIETCQKIITVLKDNIKVILLIYFFIHYNSVLHRQINVD